MSLRDLAHRLETLLDRGVGIAWVAAMPIAGLQAMFVRGRQDLLTRIESTLTDRELVARLGWREATQLDIPDDGHLAWFEDDLAILGFVAGVGGELAVERLRRSLAAHPRAVRHGEELVSAVLAAPHLLARYGEAFPPSEMPLDVIVETAAELSFLAGPIDPSNWMQELGCALHGEGPDAGIDRVIAAVLAAARSYAGAYIDALAGRTDGDIEVVEKRLARVMSDLTPAHADDAERCASLARHTTALAETGHLALASDAVERVLAVWGPPERWSSHAFQILCAGGRIDDALRHHAVTREHERVFLINAFARGGRHAELQQALDTLLDHAQLVTTLTLSTLLAPAGDTHAASLSPRELVRLGPLLTSLAPEAPQRTLAADRFAATLRALPTT